MPLLYYWRGDNYRHDLDFGVGYPLNQANPLLHTVDRGDSLWAFTRRADGAYVLAAELVAAAKTLNPPGYRYGRFRLWGDLTRSRYFSVAGQPDITVLIRSLSISAGGDVLGRAFQGGAAVRQLEEQDHQILAEYAAPLPLEPRARLVPEEQLEALLLAGDEAAVAHLLHDEPSGLAEQRRRYLTVEATRRDLEHVVHLRDLYGGACQVCRWAPRASYGTDICEVHHVRWLSGGGLDELSNLVLLCPNHHGAVHRCDAPYDFVWGGFVFGLMVEVLAEQRHTLAA